MARPVDRSAPGCRLGRLMENSELVVELGKLL
jgi:hypothetical protein